MMQKDYEIGDRSSCLSPATHIHKVHKPEPPPQSGSTVNNNGSDIYATRKASSGQKIKEKTCDRPRIVRRTRSCARVSSSLSLSSQEIFNLLCNLNV